MTSISRNHDDPSSTSSSSHSSSKRIKSNDVNVRPWSDFNHDVLSLVMMQLGVIDFLAFSGVCKSWRSVALSNRKRSCVGITCGYLILFKRKKRDFWLVNPITRHEIRFRPVPSACFFYATPKIIAVLVNSPSISTNRVLVMLNIDLSKIWLSSSTAAEGSWNLVSSTFYIKYLHVFKGKIYTICSKDYSSKVRHLCELTLNPKPALTLIETKNFPNDVLNFQKLVSSGENLYVMESFSFGLHNVHELDFGKKEWVRFEETTGERAFFLSKFRHSAVDKPELWADPRSQRGQCYFTNENTHGKFFTMDQWYFPHEC
ncbi:unnamed protein product [Lactuca virosa]|uniref:KIB1-4 beta-propeller domain-containing protein n=1 Tax=Lactuca virosa TaxID=75947 RepID=A0AAU9NAE0_9ASTR|nr:unnamed protein product [Lactuca virosa]